MNKADEILDDEELIETVYEASVVTSKPANDGHLKTGQRRRRRDKGFYSFTGK
jgi:hypothetical protein